MVSTSIILQYVVNGVVIGSKYVLLAMGLNLVFGILDIADFAQGNLYLLSAYLLFLFTVTIQLPFVLAAVFAVGVTGLVGVAYYYLVYRKIIDEPPITMFLAAFGLFSTLQGFVFFYWGPDYRSVPQPLSGTIEIANVFITQMRLVSIVVTALVILFTFWLITRTRAGRSIRAVAQNPTKAKLLGINTHRTFALTFLIASLLSGIAGVTVAPLFTVTPFIGLDAIVKGFIVAIFGGLGSVRGALVAGYILGISESLAVIWVSSEVASSIGFVILILVLLFKTEGLFGREEVAG